MKKIILKLMTVLVITNMTVSFATAPEQISFWNKASEIALPVLQKARVFAHAGLEKMRDNLGWATLAAVWGTAQIGVVWWYKRLSAEKKREIARLKKEEKDIKAREEQIISMGIHQNRTIRSLKSKIDQLQTLINPALDQDFSLDFPQRQPCDEENPKQVLSDNFLKVCSEEKQRLKNQYDGLNNKRKQEIAEYFKKKEELQHKINNVHTLFQDKQKKEYDLTVLTQNQNNLKDTSVLLQQESEILDLQKKIDGLREYIERLDREIDASDQANSGIMAQFEEDRRNNNNSIDGEPPIIAQRISKLKSELAGTKRRAWDASFFLTATAGMFVLGGVGLSKLSGYLASKV